MRSNRTIQRLVLGNNACGDSSMSALREALLSNAVLTDLDLCCNGISAEGIAQAADGISFCASLTRLNVRDNAFTASGPLQTFARACALSDSLLSIDIGSCGLGSRGAMAFEGCIASSSSITELNMSYNHVDDVAADGIAKAITVSKRLRVLDLVGNSLAPTGAELLLNALQRNPNIKSLALQGNANLPRAVHKKLEALLLARRGDEYRRGTNEVPPIRRPATLPFD
jgi:Ran GTPase-activating protein (RanGAP) involved in mRNA processing and transport